MIVSFRSGGRAFEIDAGLPIDISIPLNFNGPQPNAYGVEPAASKPCEAGDLVGDTRRGGSCNFEQYTFIPHCSGTHTECVGHITHERISVRGCLTDAFAHALLVSVEPMAASGNPANDRIITEDILAAATRAAAFSLAGGALIVRTLPNDGGKLAREYGSPNVPPYFSAGAMRHIVELGVRHLLVDLPSVDRIYDEGRLANHRIFWNVEPGSFQTGPESRIDATITELIYVPDEVLDGEYLLNLQIAPFNADASPSRPVIFAV